jgi:tetratricopeptide (TPR) repeat protein/tRNA A-37 threonylcarbamoyl transferase component Bud32
MKSTEAVDDVLAAYLEAERLGQAPTPEVWCAQHPGLANELETFLTDWGRFRRIADAIPPVPFAHLDGAPAEVPPTIANYEILGELGRGGMAVVYKARQTSLQRLVALKMVQENGFAEGRLARFRVEAEAVARFKHPNIVQIHEIGEHEGRPFFSLEYVDGGTLAQRIVGQPQPTRQAAAITETLARAIDYAHEQGVVHRDLKPANVLLTMQGMPKIADFGLAKRLEGTNANTRTGAIVGTPSYLSPEQALGRKDVGRPTDIFALGGILYELLTGRPPFRGDTPMETILQATSCQIPSLRAQRPEIPRDLETICLKCLEKDPRKRYPSAWALATDLRHFLNGEAIEARPIGGLEFCWRWCRRRPVLSVLMAAIVCVVCMGGVAALCMWRQAEANVSALKKQQKLLEEQKAESDRLREEAEGERKRAEENLRKANQAVDEFFTSVSEDQLLNVPGLQPLRQHLLECARRYYEGFRDQGNDPALQRRLAQAYYRLGRVTGDIGPKAEALGPLRQARSLYAELLRTAKSDDRELLRAAAEVDTTTALLEWNLGRTDEAVRSYRRAEAALLALHRTRPDEQRIRNDLALVYDNLGGLQLEAGRTEQARACYEQGRDLLDRPPFTDLNQLELLVSSCSHLAALHAKQGRKAEALQLADRAVTLAERLTQFRPNQHSRAILADAHAGHGYVFSAAGDYAEALAPLQQSRNILEELVRDNPALSRFRRMLAENLNNLGAAYWLLKRPAEGTPLLERARDLHEQVAREDPKAPAPRGQLASTLRTLGLAEVDAGQFAEAARHLERARAIWDQLAREYPANANYRAKRDECAREAKAAAQRARHGI